MMENKSDETLMDQITDMLKKAQTGKSAIPTRLKDWRVYLMRTEMISLGIKNNAAGSVYSPPAAKLMEKAELFLVWEDEKCSKAVVQNPPPGRADHWADHWAAELVNWRAAAFSDPYRAPIPAPQALPEVKVIDAAVEEVTISNRETLFEYQRKILDERPRQAMSNGHIMAMLGNHRIWTSTGLNAAYHDSRFAVSWSFDSIVGESFARRRLISGAEWRSLWDNSVITYNQLQTDGCPVSRNTIIILTPSVVFQMIEQYVLPNFRGENVLEGQSRFAVNDFVTEAVIGDTGLTLDIDPLQPDKWASYRMTGEGIPAMRTTLLSAGKIKSPYLNLKDAGRWNAAPTAIPQGAAGIRIGHSREEKWEELIGTIDDGIIILSVLGLHTQNPVTGTFSLSAPHALRIMNGTVTGRTDVRITGNFWDILKDSNTQYATEEYHDHPYVLYAGRPENQ